MTTINIEKSATRMRGAIELSANGQDIFIIEGTEKVDLVANGKVIHFEGVDQIDTAIALLMAAKAEISPK